MGYQPSPIDNWMSNGDTYINKGLKISPHTIVYSKTSHTCTLTKMNDNINMDSTIAELITS